jgi:hypothetical protein
LEEGGAAVPILEHSITSGNLKAADLALSAAKGRYELCRDFYHLMRQSGGKAMPKESLERIRESLLSKLNGNFMLPRGAKPELAHFVLRLCKTYEDDSGSVFA